MANHIECANCGKGLSKHNLYYRCPDKDAKWFEEDNMSFYWWNEVAHKKTYRNDFTSHGAYIFLLTMLAMFVVGLFGGDVWWMATIGALVGFAVTLLREGWDEYARGALEPLDIISGMIAVTLSEVILLTLTGGL